MNMNLEPEEQRYPIIGVVNGFWSFLGTPYGQLPESEKLIIRNHLNEKRELQNR